MEGNRVAGEAPYVGGEEVEDGGHHLAQHVNVKPNSGQAADDHHERVAVMKEEKLFQDIFQKKLNK